MEQHQLHQHGAAWTSRQNQQQQQRQQHDQKHQNRQQEWQRDYVRLEEQAGQASSQWREYIRTAKYSNY